MSTTRWSHGLLLAVLGLLIIVYLRFEPVQWAHYTDPVVYLCGAQSIAEGEGYRYAAYVNTPRIGCHPPLQSAYLSLFWGLNPEFPANLPLLYGAMIGLSIAVFALFAHWNRRNGVPLWIAALLILAWGLASPWGTLIYSFFSDILFVGLCLGLACCWHGVSDFNDRKRWVVTGILLALLYLTRTAATPIIGVIGLILVWRARRLGEWTNALVALAPPALAVVGWKLWKSGAPGYGDYINFRVMEMGGLWGLVQQSGSNAFEYLTGLGFLHSLLPGLMNLPSAPWIVSTIWSPILTLTLMLLGWLFTACWVYGFWHKGTKLDRVMGLLVLAYLLQLVVYPTNLGERCLYPALPFVLVWAWKGRSVLKFEWLESRVLAGATALFLAAAAAGNAFSFVESMSYLKRKDYASEVAEVGEWLRQNTPPDTVVAAALSEPIMHLHHSSQRKVIENYFQPHPWFSIISHDLQDTPNADYILMSWYSWMKLEESNFLRFEKVAGSRNNYFRLYKIGSGSPPAPAPSSSGRRPGDSWSAKMIPILNTNRKDRKM